MESGSFAFSIFVANLNLLVTVTSVFVSLAIYNFPVSLSIYPLSFVFVPLSCIYTILEIPALPKNSLVFVLKVFSQLRQRVPNCLLTTISSTPVIIVCSIRPLRL